jgi:hypothetical protein
LATFFIFEKGAKNGKKVRLYSLNFSSIFSHFFHFWKRGTKWQKSIAISLTFLPLGKWEKSKATALKCLWHEISPKGLLVHCKDHLKWFNNFFYRILVTCSLFKIFNFVSYANITGVTSHHIMSSQKSIVFLTNTYLKNLKIAFVYVLIS